MDCRLRRLHVQPVWRSRSPRTGSKGAYSWQRFRCGLAAPLLGLVVLTAPFAGLEGERTVRARHVVIIGVDGMKGEAAVNAKTPNMRQMMNDGAYTLHARAVIPFSSKPN